MAERAAATVVAAVAAAVAAATEAESAEARRQQSHRIIGAHVEEQVTRLCCPGTSLHVLITVVRQAALIRKMPCNAM